VIKIALFLFTVDEQGNGEQFYFSLLKPDNQSSLAVCITYVHHYNYADIHWAAARPM